MEILMFLLAAACMIAAGYVMGYNSDSGMDGKVDSSMFTFLMVVLYVLFILLGVARFESRPKKSPIPLEPDTLVVTKNQVKDTTYIYYLGGKKWE